MRATLLFFLLLFAFTSVHAQFHPTETRKGLTIMVSDGTAMGKHSQIQPKSEIPTSYDYVTPKSGEGVNGVTFNDPIRELGMTECIQAAAFLERPEYGKIGYMLIFSVNDSIGGKQALYTVNGETFKGVYRLIRQKTSYEEEIPQGMTGYSISGTFFLLGIS